MSFFQSWRMKDWEPINAEVYAKAYELFGGSVITHPTTINAMSEVADIPVAYYAKMKQGVPVAVIPVWQKWLAGSKQALKKLGKKGIVDMGNAEVILPISDVEKVSLPVRSDQLSSLHKANITNLKSSATELCLAKPHTTGGLSKKFRYNQRRELRLLEERGLVIKSVDSLNSEELSVIYIELFEKRWGFQPTGHERLSDVVERMRPLLFGSYLELDNKPVAFQLLYAVECVKHISMEFINGGVDPSYNEMSPGSVLSFLNTQQAWLLSDKKGKPLRYSFGKADAEYKDRWCTRVETFSR